MPYLAASSRPASSAVTIVMRSARQPADVAQDQRQDALADAAEADEDQAARKMRVNRVLAHDFGKSVILGIEGAECTANPRERGAIRSACSRPTASIWLALAIDPVFRKDWLLENAIVFVAIPLFVLTARRLRFSDFAYTCLFVFFVFHADRRALHLLARAIRRLVAVDRRRRRSRGAITTTASCTFVYGLLVTPAAVEIFAHYGRYARPLGLPVALDVHGRARRSSTRLIEFAAALAFGGDLGQAYLGTQGDIWDGQKDMALALVGTTIMLTALAAAGRLPVRAQDKREPARRLWNRVARATRGESGGLEGERRRPAAALARALDLDGAAPEFALGVRHERQGARCGSRDSAGASGTLSCMQLVHGE